MPPSPAEVATLRVAVCRTATAPADTSEARRVICPIRGEGVPVESCVRCEHLVDLTRDSALSVSVVRCEMPTGLLQRQRIGRRVSRLAAQKTRVASLLARNVLCVGARLPATDAAALLVDAGASEAVVVDERRRPVGLVAETDLLAAAEEPHARYTVGELMSAVAVTLVETASLATAAALIARDRLSSLPVVDQQGRVVGVITPFDLVGWLAPPSL